MNSVNLERADLKVLLKEIMKKDASLFKEVIKEILVEEEQALRRAKIEAMIKEDFDKYDDVFKALA